MMKEHRDFIVKFLEKYLIYIGSDHSFGKASSDVMNVKEVDLAPLRRLFR